MKRTYIYVLSTLMVLGAFTLLAPTTDVLAQAGQIKEGVDSVDANTGGGLNFEEGIKTIVNVMLFVLGAIAVIMIIIGGIRYTISNGDQGQLTSAKNTILYAVIGLIVAILAYAIVNFVIDSFGGNGG